MYQHNGHFLILLSRKTNGNQDTLKLLRSKIPEGSDLVCFVPRVNPGAPLPLLPVLVLLGASMPLKCESQLL